MLVEIKILSIVRQTLHGDHLDLQIPNKVNVLSLVRERVEAGSDLPDTHEQAWTSNVWSCGPAQYFSFIFRYPLSLCHIIIIILSKYRSLQQVSAQLRKALQVNIIKKDFCNSDKLTYRLCPSEQCKAVFPREAAPCFPEQCSADTETTQQLGFSSAQILTVDTSHTVVGKVFLTSYVCQT